MPHHAQNLVRPHVLLGRQSLEQIGDRWTLLIVREAFYGTRRFSDFAAQLGVAPNILSARLGGLVEAGVFSVSPSPTDSRALEYRLTGKGRDLFPVIVAIAQWGDKHVAGRRGPPIRIVEKATGEEIAPLDIRSRDGRPLALNEVSVLEGPGATATDKQRFQAARAKAQA